MYMPARAGMKKGGNLIMNVCFSASVFTLLLAGFYGLMEGMGTNEDIKKKATLLSRRLDEKGRENALRKREAIRMRADREGVWARIDRALVYSCIVRYLPGITTEKFIAFVCALSAFVFIAVGIAFGIVTGMVCTTVFLFAVYACIRLLEIYNLRRTGNDLPRLLDLLGSYAASGAVYSNIFGQISMYMNEPLRSAFDECEAEGRMSGDISMALLSMADKIEHPQFKQLIRNMEITSRHGEDITGLVADTRRSLRDYLKESSDRKAMLRESAINMILLLVMSFAVLAITTSLSETTVKEVILGSLPGRVTIGVMAGVFLMYFGQATKLYK